MIVLGLVLLLIGLMLLIVGFVILTEENFKDSIIYKEDYTFCNYVIGGLLLMILGLVLLG